MSRPREFDRQKVLDRAMELLWEKGIESTSISDLCEHMGIGKASLYDTFGSKEKLIFEAMDCYVSLMKEKILSSLTQPGPARVILLGFFTSLIERSYADQTRSCLIAKAAMMTGRRNEELMTRVGDFMGLLENAFHALVCRGIDSGEFAADKNPRAIARFFVNAMQGLSVTATTRVEQTTLTDVVRTTISILD